MADKVLAVFSSNSPYKRPTAFITNSTDVTVQNLKFTNSPNVFISMTGGSKDVASEAVELSAVSTSANPAHNTDGWDIGGSTFVTVDNAVVVDDGGEIDPVG